MVKGAEYELERDSVARKLEFAYKVINVVALGVLALPEGEKVDLDAVARETCGRGVRRFPGIVFKVRHASVVLFKNGKMVLTGLKAVSEIPGLIRELEVLFGAVGVRYDDFAIEVQNLVVMTHLGQHINLESSCLVLDNCIYEPEQFPACIVRSPGCGTFLVFANSKIIGLGFKSEEQARASLKELVSELFECELIY
ncbi:MAG: TATA-box-binding protein [Promethearchaeota archaeon]